MSTRRLVLGLSMRYLGYHAAGWRHPGANAAGTTSFAHYRTVAQAAETAGFDLVFLADGMAVRVRDEPKGAFAQSSQVADFEPLTLLSALAAVTSRIGLVATASTTYNQPYSLARQYASLDLLSGGRAGWNVVTSWSDAEARNFGLDTNPDYATRYHRAEEFVDVVTGLWDSWDEDALLHDKDNACFLDPAKLHTLNHQGDEFRVRGPLSVPRSPQRRPVIVQAGASDAGMNLAARTADLVYTAPQSQDAAITFRSELRERAAAFGRDPDALRVLPGFVPFTGLTEEDARAASGELNELIPDELARQYLYNQMGNLSDHPLDGPVPDPQAGASVGSIARNLADMAQRDNLTLRELARVIASGYGARVVVDAGKHIAAEMLDWFHSGAADGFNICAPLLPETIGDFYRHVMPVLEKSGLLTDRNIPTLRGRIGLPAPASRYA
ncbi:LLM class flavin-dependent oxidoreductase [Acetobacter oeni]|uniref:Monooxygenase n=1 Tax=Acetobacter oeni TaxID=304077 RepID=A0A511XK12_9PROT|nr:LLM class flavin-dependent oxidoreductase [Acetobacter oeni]MBB3883492.1 FMN-dependent oxidoreductase (nitrilotriacetate monooxygenase family) [Acetobacter oeni]NHO19449.1 NtaA/DmoA family FMN-dependent monooxygenase [Acetobacter oeni]GBR04126.1 xenobiotic compound DszA family monooxygenase [Acetobacter oeni LMG 21952]GEN63269.1 monooxygenase [Acetobacter oeni]